jgi:glycerophosphoryl diester phosphodiesterase
MNKTALFAHRGASLHYPENTMVAFEAAYQLGADGIEFDVQLSKDFVPVVIHDATLNRTTNGSGYVGAHTVEQLKSLSAGSWFDAAYTEEAIPTLEEVCIWASDKEITLNIELKGAITQREHVVKTILPIINEYELTKRVILSSFDHNVIHQALKVAPELQSAVIVTAALYKPERYVKEAGVLGYHFMSPLLLEEEAKALILAGIKIRPYTVNSEELLKMYMKWGCAGIFTDNPKLALQVREQLNDKE